MKKIIWSSRVKPLLKVVPTVAGVPQGPIPRPLLKFFSRHKMSHRHVGLEAIRAQEPCLVSATIHLLTSYSMYNCYFVQMSISVPSIRSGDRVLTISFICVSIITEVAISEKFN